MKMNEYFTDIISHHEHPAPVAPPQAKSPEKPAPLPRSYNHSPIRMHDTHRSTLVLGEREPATHDGCSVRKELQKAASRRAGREASCQRCTTPHAAVVDQ